jgi:hypothetical protein
MEIHLLITLHLGVVLFETTSSALDLDPAARLLLDVFHVRSTCSDNLGAQVETRNGLEIDRDALFGPLAATQVVALDLRYIFSWATETAFVDQIGQFLLHHLFDLLYSQFEAFLGGAGDVEVKRWVLARMSLCSIKIRIPIVTHRSGGHALIGIIVSSRGDILKYVSSLDPKVIIKSFMDGAYRRQFLL